METVKANIKIIYQGKDISADIQPLLKSFTYTDKTEGESDEISITVRNDDKRWYKEWQPQKSDTITAEIISEKGEVLNCGIFTVDNLTGSKNSGSGAECTIRALAAGVNDPIRSKHTVAHENKTIREIAQKIADKHGYTISGNIKPIRLRYEAQNKETDLAFLHRISMQYGYVFSLRHNKLIFMHIQDMHQADSVLTISLDDASGGYTLDDRLTKIYNAARFRHRNGTSKKLIQQEYAASADTGSKDVLEIRHRVDNEEQAEAISKSKLYRANLQQVSIDVNDVPGSVYLVAGNNVTHTDIGNYDGKYAIEESTHSIGGDGGWTVTYKSKKLTLV